MAEREEELIDQLRRQRIQRGTSQARVDVPHDEGDEEPDLSPEQEEMMRQAMEQNHPPRRDRLPEQRMEPPEVPPAPRQRVPEPPRAREQRPQRLAVDDVRVAPRQRHQEPPRREEPQDAPPPPKALRGDYQEPRDHLMDRATIAKGYNVAFGFFGLICEVNSFYTTVVGVYFLWSIMFDNAKFAGVLGFIIASAIFLGEVLNSDFHEEVTTVDEATGEEQTKLVGKPNRKRNYYLWLTPDAGFTILFWIAPFVRVFTYAFFNSSVQAGNIREVADLMRIAWNAQYGMTFFFFCLLPATILASAWSVVSAYYPEKALLGPRTRDKIRAAVRAAARLQGAVRA